MLDPSGPVLAVDPLVKVYSAMMAACAAGASARTNPAMARILIVFIFNMMLGICLLGGVPEDVVVEIGEGEKGGCGGKRGFNERRVTGGSSLARVKSQKVENI